MPINRTGLPTAACRLCPLRPRRHRAPAAGPLVGRHASAGVRRRGQRRAALVARRDPARLCLVIVPGAMAHLRCLPAGRRHLGHGRANHGRPAQPASALLLRRLRPVPLADLVPGREGADPHLESGSHLGLGRILADAGAAGRRAARAALRGDDLEGPARLERDGKRVVYSSYLGRQWHQLWVMTADGGDPFQLTYGEGDATAARWSPDGRRVAYISNEDGNTALRIVDVPGGAVERWRRAADLPGAGGAAAADGGRRTDRPRHARAGLDHRGRWAEASRPTMPGATPTMASIASSGGSSTATSTAAAHRW